MSKTFVKFGVCLWQVTCLLHLKVTAVRLKITVNSLKITKKPKKKERFSEGL